LKSNVDTVPQERRRGRRNGRGRRGLSAAAAAGVVAAATAVHQPDADVDAVPDAEPAVRRAGPAGKPGPAGGGAGGGGPAGDGDFGDRSGHVVLPQGTPHWHIILSQLK